MRILLIEDCLDLADAIATKLRRDGHQVIHVTDGKGGEEHAASEGFSVIVLDINLPIRDGFEVLSSIRRQRITTPVLVMTARNQVADKVSLLDLGADDYVIKPCDLSEISARVRALVRRSHGVAQDELVLGELSIDMAQRCVTLHGQPLGLGRREYDMLEALATSKGKPVNKEHLVLKLFGYDDTGSLNAVELLVSRLRRKLKHSGVEIGTQRGVGYWLRHN